MDILFCDILDKMHRKDINYEGGVGGKLDQLMQVGRVFPIISKMHKVTILSFGGNTSPHQQNTIIFEYNKISGTVVLQERTGTVWATPPPGTICITGDDHLHFNFINEKKTKD